MTEWVDETGGGDDSNELYDKSPNRRYHSCLAIIENCIRGFPHVARCSLVSCDEREYCACRQKRRGCIAVLHDSEGFAVDGGVFDLRGQILDRAS